MTDPGKQDIPVAFFMCLKSTMVRYYIPVPSQCCGSGTHFDADHDSACHFDADPDPDPDCHFDADPDPDCHFDADPHPDPACHFYADPDPTFLFDVDPDPSFKIKAQTLKNCKNRLIFIHFVTCVLIRIRIQLITSMRIRIQLISCVLNLRMSDSTYLKRYLHGHLFPANYFYAGEPDSYEKYKNQQVL
jgi:hypothetical protein